MSNKPVTVATESLDKNHRSRAIRSFVWAGACFVVAAVVLFPKGAVYSWLRDNTVQWFPILLVFMFLAASAFFLFRGFSFWGVTQPSWLNKVNPNKSNRTDLIVFDSEDEARNQGWDFSEPMGRMGQQRIFDKVERGGISYGFVGLKGRSLPSLKFNQESSSPSPSNESDSYSNGNESSHRTPLHREESGLLYVGALAYRRQSI